MIKISAEEIRKRFQKLYNYEKVLYPQLKERSDKLREKNKALKQENEKLKKESKQMEKILLELEELKEMVYGKKQKQRKGDKVILVQEEDEKEKIPNRERSKESYRKREPKLEEITGEIHFDLSVCPDCGSDLIQRKEHVHYREDLEGLDVLLKQAKKITKRIIESGYCIKCGQRKRATNIPEQTVTIGQNTKATIVYLNVLLGLSYREIKEYLNLNYNIDVSDGMIAKSLEEQANLLKPYYQENIYQSLLQEKGNHYDESSWKIQGESEGNYVWVKTGIGSNKVLFWFGRSRGKGVAEKLRGDKEEENVANQVGISDDYGSYRNLFKYHQLCWAHPHRKLRDLAESSILKESVRKHCENVYKNYKKLYLKAEKVKNKFDLNKYKTEKEKFKAENQLKSDFDKLTIINNKDPDKLQRIKESLKSRKEKYFTFLKVLNIPLDNNKAERALRRIVLKRKKSFGCKTQKGANILSILYSVVFSIYWENPPNQFFEHYQEALKLDQKQPQ